ncbi:phospholipase A1 precursor, EC 3.1. 1.4); Outer membrane phospholipase A [Formosa agariphila KMM 3901]|uniref:Phosphatidylcholine 1-acylhydrolase n=1 Tax=Formosa agariphila (strain DSM 15362 / KCTC 12365 / LMG 23005 / KMM 3901 / M-2Alg 35-1) TaxID=1347342 RepID=T2KK54_FORAG|nr:phospholipase A [Formosa agariphila]CDF79277.1 phospholipase A1 precursor, EC 3.1. 1.4); Outer membrane phospholipase A [Formosa agariphila KMM 3901]
MRKQFLILGLFFIVSHVFSQTYTREEVNRSLNEDARFSIHEDNYIITGIPTNKHVDSETADIKYQISFKQLLSRNPIVWDSYLYVTYTQKAFWNIYEFSSPFEEINFNPSVGLSKVVYNNNDEAKAIVSLMLNHESNGRDSIYSRSWNSINLKYSTALSKKSILSVELWAPFVDKVNNPDLIDYIGISKFTYSYDIIPEKLNAEIALKKGLEWDWKGSIRTRLYYNPFKSTNQYFMLEYFAGYGESLINYEQFNSMVRLGFVIKTNELEFLKYRIQE